MRNVLQLMDSFNQGGTESQTVQLMRLLHESGNYRVLLASLSAEGPLRAEVERLGFHDIPYFPLQNFYNLNAVNQLKRMASFMREADIHLVHAHDFYTNIFGMAAATLARVPARIASRRETEGIRSPAKRWVERRAFRAAKSVVANAEAIRQQLIGEGLPAHKVVTIYNGIDVARVTPDSGIRRDALLNSFDLPGSCRFVTIVANMRHVMKDQATFLRAARLTLSAVPDSAFILAGEGEQTEGLRGLATELGLGDRVFFIGRSSRIADLLTISDVCVLSSKGVEGFSNSILEYMAAGRAVVATNVGGASEAIVEGETGHLVNSGDDATMAARILELLRNPERRMEMGANGRRVVEERFSLQSRLSNTSALYQRMLR